MSPLTSCCRFRSTLGRPSQREQIQQVYIERLADPLTLASTLLLHPIAKVGRCVRAMPKCRVIQTVDLVPSSGAMDTSLLVRGHAAREGIEMKHRREKSMRASDIPYFQLLCHITPWKDLDSRAYIEVCLALSRIHDDDARKQCHCIRFFQHETYTQRRKVGFSHIRSQGMMWIS